MAGLYSVGAGLLSLKIVSTRGVNTTLVRGEIKRRNDREMIRKLDCAIHLVA